MCTMEDLKSNPAFQAHFDRVDADIDHGTKATVTVIELVWPFLKLLPNKEAMSMLSDLLKLTIQDAFAHSQNHTVDLLIMSGHFKACDHEKDKYK